MYRKSEMYDIMDITQSNYSNMLVRLSHKKKISNVIITYYSIALIVYSLTGEFFPNQFNIKLSSYFNIILSIVVLTYSLIIANANYSDRICSAEKVMNDVKAKKRELTEDNVNEKRKEYDEIVAKAEYRTDIDFFRTLKQRCRKNNISWLHYKRDIENIRIQTQDKNNEIEKLNGYLSENFPILQQLTLLRQYMWDAIMLATPVVLFVICVWF